MRSYLELIEMSIIILKELFPEKLHLKRVLKIPDGILTTK